MTAAGLPWADVTVLDACGSTNAVLLQDARPWRVVAAGEQTAGRGRLDRSWSTPPGVALALSVSLPLPDDIGRLAWFSPMSAMAMTRALADVTGVRVGWKWPNDVLGARRDGQPAAADGAEWGKLCGLLGQVSPVGTLVMGVGVNIAQTAAELPVPVATSVALCGGRVAEGVREELVVAFARHLAALHADAVGSPDAVARLAGQYRSGCLTVGRQVRVAMPDGTTLEGVAEGVDEGAQLVVRDGARSVHLGAGDVVHVRAAAGGYA